MKRIVICAMLSVACCLNAAELAIHPSRVSVSPKLGKISLVRTMHGFEVVRDGVRTQVPLYDVDAQLRAFNPEQLKTVLQACSIRVDRRGDNDYKLSLQGGLKGGSVDLVAYAAIINVMRELAKKL